MNTEETQKDRSYAYEENPFEDEVVASEWITSVEHEQGMSRDTLIYPCLREWIKEINPEHVLEIGSGQGICSLCIGDKKYIGVEPSTFLVERAKQLYGKDYKREFLVGNAYKLPIETHSQEAVFSVNVWFHLNDLKVAAEELARVLTSGGKFLIITANPDRYEIWKEFFEGDQEEENVLIGKVNTPVVPLSKNIFYMHSLEAIRKSLEDGGFNIEKIEELTDLSKDPSNKLFIQIRGEKI